MLKLPKWIMDIFEKSVCPFPDCKVPLEEAGVVAEGIREEYLPNTTKPVLSFYYEYKCKHCGNRSVFTGFQTTIEDFIADMMEVAGIDWEDFVMEDDDDDDTDDTESQPRGKSKISSSEYNHALRMLKKAKYYEDFLKSFGIDKVSDEPDENEQNK